MFEMVRGDTKFSLPYNECEMAMGEPWGESQWLEDIWVLCMGGDLG